MIFPHLNVIEWLLSYRYAIIFPLMVVEGPITTLAAGFLSSLGYLKLIPVYLIVVAGDLGGDTIYYAIGRWGRRPLEKWGKYIKLTKERIQKLESLFEQHGGKTLIAGKLSHAVGSVVLITAGIAKIPYRKFIWFNLLATLPKSLVLVLIGYYFGNAYVKYRSYVDVLGALIIGAFFVIIYFFLKDAGRKLSKT